MSNRPLEDIHRFTNYMTSILLLWLFHLLIYIVMAPFIDIAIFHGIDDFPYQARRILDVWQSGDGHFMKFYRSWLSGFFREFGTLPTSILLAIGGSFVGFIILFAQCPYRPVRTHHGRSRFATLKDVKMWGWQRDIHFGLLKWKAWLLPFAFVLYLSFKSRRHQNLLADEGMLLGRFNGRDLRTDETLSALCLAPPGAGKTAGLAIPTLLSDGMDNWSIFVFDIKGELYEKTAGYRAQHGPVMRFDPREGIGARWNPLSPEKSLPKGAEMVKAWKEILVDLEDVYGDYFDETDSFQTTAGKGAWTKLHESVTDTDWEKKKIEIYEDPELLIADFERFSGLKVPVEKARHILRKRVFPRMEIINRAHSEHENYLSRMVNAMIPEVKGGGNGEHFAKTGRAALLGMLGFTIWRCMEQDVEPNMARFIDAWNEALMGTTDNDSDGNAVEQALKEWVVECKVKGYPKRYMFELNRLINTPPEERGSIISTADSAVSIFKTDTVRKVTATSDFSLDEFRGIKGPDGITRPVTFYLVVSLEDLKSMAALMTILAESLISRLISQDAQYAEKARKTLFILDEFAQINKMNMLLSLPAVGRGQRVSTLLIAQSEGQIEETYGAPGLKQLIDTTEFKFLFPLTDPATAKKWSDAIGKRTVREETGGISGSSALGSLFTSEHNRAANVSSNWSYRGEPLVSESALMTENPGEAMESNYHMVISRRRYERPIKCKTPYYFLDEVFKERSEIQAPDRTIARGYCGGIAEKLGIDKDIETTVAVFDTSMEGEYEDA